MLPPSYSRRQRPKSVLPLFEKMKAAKENKPKQHKCSTPKAHVTRPYSGVSITSNFIMRTFSVNEAVSTSYNSSSKPNEACPRETRPLIWPVAPVAYQVILEPGIGQFREFEPRRVHTRINSLGLLVVHKLTCGKRESVR